MQKTMSVMVLFICLGAQSMQNPYEQIEQKKLEQQFFKAASTQVDPYFIFECYKEKKLDINIKNNEDKNILTIALENQHNLLAYDLLFYPEITINLSNTLFKSFLLYLPGHYNCTLAHKKEIVLKNMCHILPKLLTSYQGEDKISFLKKPLKYFCRYENASPIIKILIEYGAGAKENKPLHFLKNAFLNQYSNLPAILTVPDITDDILGLVENTQLWPKGCKAARSILKRYCFAQSLLKKRDKKLLLPAEIKQYIAWNVANEESIMHNEQEKKEKTDLAFEQYLQEINYCP